MLRPIDAIGPTANANTATEPRCSLERMASGGGVRSSTAALCLLCVVVAPTEARADAVSAPTSCPRGSLPHLGHSAGVLCATAGLHVERRVRVGRRAAHPLRKPRAVRRPFPRPEQHGGRGRARAVQRRSELREGDLRPDERLRPGAERRGSIRVAVGRRPTWGDHGTAARRGAAPRLRLRGAGSGRRRDVARWARRRGRRAVATPTRTTVR